MATKAQTLSAAANAILKAGKTAAPAPQAVATNAPAPQAVATNAPAPQAVATNAPAQATNAPAPQAVATNAPAQATTLPVVANGQVLRLGKFAPVKVFSHRGYAQAVAQHLASTNANGTFTEGQLKAALVACPLPADHPCAGVSAPKLGWAKHNMVTWGRGQGWWVVA